MWERVLQWVVLAHPQRIRGGTAQDLPGEELPGQEGTVGAGAEAATARAVGAAGSKCRHTACVSEAIRRHMGALGKRSYNKAVQGCATRVQSMQAGGNKVLIDRCAGVSPLGPGPPQAHSRGMDWAGA